MSSTYSKDLEIYTAKQFKSSVTGTSNVYLTFGYNIPWDNDSNPPQANTSVNSLYETWKYMIGGKKIGGNDIRHVIPRFDWTSGNTYIAYDNLADSRTLKSSNSQFYVMTDAYNIYKCISNNYGGVSTSKPTSTGTNQFQTADQYIWKYMYTLTDEEKLRFMTNSFIPVKTLLEDDNSLQWQVQEDAIPGAIHSILIQNKGVGYTSNNISITIKGDGNFANAYAVRNVTTSQIDSIVIDNKGSGYTYANVSFKSSGGINATARAIISPLSGHGADPLSELGGSYLMINPSLNGTEGGVLTSKNDYRQIAIVSDPLVYGTTNVSSNLAVSQVTKISLSQSSSTTNYINDEIVYQGPDLGNATFRGVVTEWDSANSLLKLVNVQGVPVAQTVIGYTSATTRYFNAIQYPDLKPYTGDLLYKDNITAISRAEDQNEDFKIVLSF